MISLSPGTSPVAWSVVHSGQRVHEAGPLLGAKKLRSAWEGKKRREDAPVCRSDHKLPEANSGLGFQSEEGSTSSGCILKAFEFGNQIFWE